MNGQSETKALSRLRKVCREALYIRHLSVNSPDFEKWYRDAMVAIRHTFGEDSKHISDFKKISFTRMGGLVKGRIDWNPYKHGLRSANALLESMIEEVEAFGNNTPALSIGGSQTNMINLKAAGSKVFVIHGRDEAAKSDIARFLGRLDLEPVILAEQPSGGRTIIEKVEAHDEVGYAVALLTPDDVGSRLGDDAVQPRARQNVIFELGYFIGRLGRERVCALTKGEPEIPSDYSGVVYIPMASDAWKEGLFKELKAAGFDVDANKVFG